MSQKKEPKAQPRSVPSEESPKFLDVESRVFTQVGKDVYIGRQDRRRPAQPPARRSEEPAGHAPVGDPERQRRKRGLQSRSNTECGFRQREVRQGPEALELFHDERRSAAGQGINVV